MSNRAALATINHDTAAEVDADRALSLTPFRRGEVGMRFVNPPTTEETVIAKYAKRLAEIGPTLTAAIASGELCGLVMDLDRLRRVNRWVDPDRRIEADPDEAKERCGI